MSVERGKRRRFVGSVVKDSMDKTVVVSVESTVKHALYGKYIKRKIKYKAHDEKNECKPGDKVSIVETRPISRTKRWRVEGIVEKAR